MGVIKMSELPDAAKKPVEGRKSRMINMNDVPDRGAQQGRKMLLKTNKKIWEVFSDGQWRGERCFIVAGGPSVNEFDLKLLEGEHTIGVNLAFRLFEPEIIFGMDTRLWGWIENDETGEGDAMKFVTSKATKVWSDINQAPLAEDIVLAPSLCYPGLSKHLKEGLGCGTNSGFGALNLALILGAKEIYLIGYDFKGGRWHKGYPAPGGVEHSYHLQCYQENADGFKKFEAKIINLNPESALRVFEFGKMPGNLKDKKEKNPDKIVRAKGQNEPVFVNYYTVDNGYGEFAKDMVASLKRFDVEMDVQAIKSKGDWDKNTRFKPTFLLKMLDKHKGRPVVWVDADSVFNEVPEKLLRMKKSIDIAGHYREGEEFITSLIYFKNNETSRDYLRACEKFLLTAEKHPYGEQQHMQNVLDKMRKQKKIKFEDLGPEYCYILLLKNPDGLKPIVEQRQASRKLRS